MKTPARYVSLFLNLLLLAVAAPRGWTQTPIDADSTTTLVADAPATGTAVVGATGVRFVGKILRHITLHEAMVALITAAAFFALIYILRLALGRWFTNRKRVTKFNVDDLIGSAIKATHWLFILILACFAGLVTLPINYGEDGFPGPLKPLLVIAWLVQIAIWANVVINHWLANYKENNLTVDAASVTTVSVMGFLAKLALYALLVLLILQNLGVQVGALLASMGIAGIAIGLAAQSMLGDLFASLAIVLDKPFVIGDFIIVGDKMGTIENIGLKTTRMRSLSGEQLIIANSDLLSARIQNYKRMTERRVVVRFGVVYQTTPEQLRQIPPMVREIIEAQELTRFDRAHFYKFGDSSLDFEVIYYMLDPDYTKMMDSLQDLHLRMMERFADLGVEFAYPTRTIFVQREEGGGS